MNYIRSHILICSGSNCQLKGCSKIRTALEAELLAKGLTKEIKVVDTGCLGLCEQGPGIVIYPPMAIPSRIKCGSPSKMSLSLNVPGSPSSALHIMYF